MKTTNQSISSSYLSEHPHDPGGVVVKDLVVLEVFPRDLLEALEGQLRLGVLVEQVEEGQDADLLHAVLQARPAGLDGCERERERERALR